MSWLSEELQRRGISTEQLTQQAQDAMMKELRRRLKSVSIRTEYGPDIDVEDPLKPGPPNPYLMALKPQITLNIDGYGPLVMAPYGKPGPTKWRMIEKATTGGGGGFAAVTLGLLVLRAFRAYQRR